MSARSHFWAACLASVVVAQAAASLVLSRRGFALAAFSDIIQCAVLLCVTTLCFLCSGNLRRRARAFWLLMGLGMATWFAYQALWTCIEVVQRREVPDLFAGDAVLFLHLVPMMAALALQANVRQDERELRLGSLDFALLLLWWIFLYFYSVLPWQYAHANESSYIQNLNLAYLFEKVAFLLGLSLLWWRSTDSWRRIYGHWFGASLLYSCSSYIANWALAHNRYYSGSLYDLPLLASMAWMAVPALVALKVPAQESRIEQPLLPGIWTARLGMLAVFSLPIFAWFSFFNHNVPGPVRNFRLIVTLAAMVLMSSLVFLRQHLLDIELIRLVRSSRQAVDDLQLLQTQLVQSEKLASLGQLVGGAAHELNNPLTAMLGYSELLATTELTKEQRALSEKISLQAKRIRTLVASLLSFAKQVPASKTPIDVNAIVQTSLKLCHAQLQNSKVRYETEFADPIPRVRGDSNQLLKVFSHIIHNAAHAMDNRPEALLIVRTCSNEMFVSIEFSDNGPGIREPGKVFDPFYTTRPIGQGPGLGLSMCYGIVQEHGGKISCANRESGGAMFVIELPACTKAASGKPQAQAHAVKL